MWQLAPSVSIAIWMLVGSAAQAPAPSATLSYRLALQSVIEQRLHQFGGKDAEREAALKELFTSVGCGDHLSEQKVSGQRLPNVICTLPGSSDRTIIVGAHYDHVSAGSGVVDNWSGAALLPSLYQAVNTRPRIHTYIFIGFTAEEQGEIGSAYYVHHMSKEEVARTDAMINMDTLGLAPTEVWTSHSDKRLTAALYLLAHDLKLPISGVNVEQVGSTDSVQFAARKIPSITIHSLTQQAWNARILHTPSDRLSAIHLDDYYDTYKLLAAFTAYLDQLPPASTGR